MHMLARTCQLRSGVPFPGPRCRTIQRDEARRKTDLSSTDFAGSLFGLVFGDAVALALPFPHTMGERRRAHTIRSQADCLVGIASLANGCCCSPIRIWGRMAPGHIPYA